MTKKLFVLCLCACLIVPSALADLSVKDIISKMQVNQKKINDMYAETTTKITSSMAFPGSKDKGPQTMTQKGKMWNKGKDKSKIEMTAPMRQVTITNGDKMAIINSETGQKIVQDMKKLRQAKGVSEPSKEMDLEKALDYFDLSVSKKGEDFVISGVPKEENKFLSKMEFYVDSDKWVPVKIQMYGPKGKLMSRSDIEYQKISDIWVPVKNVSNVDTPAGKMKVEMEFSNVKINKGISDREFQID